MKTLIAMPCMDSVDTMFLRSILGMHHVGHTEYGIAASSLVYDARNSLAMKAVSEKFDRILWLDSDMTFQPDLMRRLSEDLDEGRDFVSALYFTRKPPIKPVIFSETGYDRVGDSMEVRPYAKTMFEYPKDEIFEVASAGFGGVMMTVSLVKEIMDKYGLPFTPILGFGEDLSFCVRVSELGKRMFCDSRIKMGHVARSVITEDLYLQGVKDNGKIS